MKFIKNTLYISLAMALSAPVLSQKTDSENENNFSVGVGLNNYGLSLSGSAKTGWHLVDGDQIQTRVALSGFDADNVDDIEFSGIEYEGDVTAVAVSAGIDWFPFQGKFAEQIFFATGLHFFDAEADLESDESGDFYVGDQRITRASNTEINTKVEHSGAAPYLSVGWGNRISSNSNWAFSVELGVTQALSDADVFVTELNGGTTISQANLDKERMEIEDDANGAVGFFNIGVSYRF